MNIDFDALENSILEQLDDNIINEYDMSVILKSAELVWDETAIQVKSKDFTMIFDIISYELVQYIGLDIGE